MTSTATRARSLGPISDLYGNRVSAVPEGCSLLAVDDLLVGDVLRHAEGTFDLVTSIVPEPSLTTRRVYVLRTMPNGRTATCFFWIGEHARRTVHKVRR